MVMYLFVDLAIHIKYAVLTRLEVLSDVGNYQLVVCVALQGLMPVV